MSWLQVIGLILQIIVWILNAIKERNDELKRAKTKEIQSGVRGIIDDDISRINVALDNLRRMR